MYTVLKPNQEMYQGNILFLFKIYCTTVLGRNVNETKCMAALRLFTFLPKYAVHLISNYKAMEFLSTVAAFKHVAYIIYYISIIN